MLCGFSEIVSVQSIILYATAYLSTLTNKWAIQMLLLVVLRGFILTPSAKLPIMGGVKDWPIESDVSFITR